jgi:uncharacterized protein
MTEQMMIYDKTQIIDFCVNHHVKRFAFFGSVLRDDFSERSDIDIVVDFDPGHTPGFFVLSDMEDELAEIFHGRKIDLRTPQDLSKYFRDDVLDKMEVAYEAG